MCNGCKGWKDVTYDYVGPCLGCANDVNCRYWNNVDNGSYTRITTCTK